MKSTSGGALVSGGHLSKSWSNAQSTRSLSSGETELYALAKVAPLITGVISLASGFGGAKLDVVVLTRSTAARGIVHRTGWELGRGTCNCNTFGFKIVTRAGDSTWRNRHGSQYSRVVH